MEIMVTTPLNGSNIRSLIAKGIKENVRGIADVSAARYIQHDLESTSEVSSAGHSSEISR